LRRGATRRRLATAAVALTVLAGALAIADRLFPPDISRFERQSTVVLDRDGHILRAFTTKSRQWRLGTTARDVDPLYLKMLKAYEDKGFDDNWGVDPAALGRAAAQWVWFGHIVSGGSTLTMQVARLLGPRRPRGIVTKLVQIVRALQLDERYSKRRILAMYLTLAPFGGNLEGARAASLAYFGQEPNRLTPGEAALLVALPQSPERLRPDRHAAAARRGRDKVLARLEADGVLSPGQAADAEAEPVPDRRRPLPFAAPHLAQDLAARAPGRTIPTRIDGGLERRLAILAAAEADRFADGADIAAIVVRNSTRDVIGYLGGVGYFHRPAGQLDLARAWRSPGSALKPFIYGMAFDDGDINPMTLIEDRPERFGDYAPKDFDREFRGTVTVREALADSLNVPAVAVLSRVGPVRFVSDLQEAGVRLATTRLAGMPSLPVALGGVGIRLVDLTMLYVGLADGGVAAPLAYTAHPSGATHRLMSATAAWYVTNILADSSKPDGWGQGIGVEATRPIAFKTGTSYGYRDAWSVGFSPGYTVGVWVGRADGTPRPGHYGRNTATPLMLKIFALLPAESSCWRPPPPDALIVSSNAALPPNLRRFRSQTQSPVWHRAMPPRILFPSDGITLETEKDAPDVVLKAAGGVGDLFWIVNGQPIGHASLGADMFWRPNSDGFARIAVIDRDGNHAAVVVRVRIAR
jgi:penicillin-binding protein 1C